MPAHQEVTGDPTVGFFDFLSVADQTCTGLTLHALHLQKNCRLSLADLLRLQHTLWFSWVDKLKTVPEESLTCFLSSIPQKLWNPQYARPDLSNKSRPSTFHVGEKQSVFNVIFKKFALP